ncbi:DUF5317 family protein [Luteipulveratus sp. YIM 133132]|uniref:DUF5317 family protein n=1 Tax=Luteipulveratus flavus TaxID=3031728 RepID=UPI0023AF05EC|nr:DUF5317 family protein [Luteipulveratus sp. YIM 133132]MDE9367223.1 DUF5317 family protein [Luteipulveratus sp. YIM 133132]
MPGPKMLMLMLLPGFVIAAFILAAPRRFEYEGIRVRAWWLIPVAAVTMLVYSESWYPPVVGDQWALRLAVTITVVIAIAFCVLNWKLNGRVARVGLGLIVVGALCNALPQWTYGAMPFSVSAARAAGFGDAELARMARRSVRNLPITDEPWWVVALSDVIPLPPLLKVLSVGDLLLIVGGVVAVLGMFVIRPDRSRLSTRARTVEP